MDKSWKYSLFMKNPKERAGVMSRLSFCWMNSFIKISNRRALDPCDLYPLLDEDSSKELTEKLDASWSKEIRDSYLKGKEARLTRALVRILQWSEFALLSFSLFIGVACNILEPLLLGLLLSELLSNKNARSSLLLYVYSGGLCLSSLLRAIVLNQFHAKAQLLGMRWRSATTGLIYKKALRLRQKEIAKVSNDTILELVSRDCQRFDQIILKTGFLVQGSLEIIAITAFLWQLVDLPALTGMAFVVFLIGYYIGMWDVCVRLRSRIRHWLVRRMFIIRNIVSSLRYVKMNAWEWIYKEKALKYRRKEAQVHLQKSAILASFATLFYTSTTVAVFVSLTTLAVTNVQLNVYNIFMTVALIRMIRLSSSSLYASAVSYISEYSASVCRIQGFLQIEETSHLEMKNTKLKRSLKSRSFLDLSKNEFSEYVTGEDVNKIYSDIKKTATLEIPKYNEEFAESSDPERLPEGFVSLNNLTCFWNGDKKPPVLQNVTFKANAKELTLINGPSGCGKSSLLATILGELPSIEGTISHEGKIAYVPQNPVIFTESFRHNIIFGRTFNPFRYQAVINACNLQKLLNKLPDGDLTIIGSQGIQMTDDQRARIGLARAAFADADIYLLDDPLRLVKPKTAEQVFDKCICGLLSKRLRIMVSRQLQYVERADQILTMRGGTIINEVTSPMMGYKPVKLHGVGCGNGTGNLIKEKEKVNNSSLRDDTEVILADVHQATQDVEQVLHEVKWTTYWEFLKIGMWSPLILLGCLMFLGIQVALTAPDVWLLYISHTPTNLMTSDHTWYIYSALVASSFILVIIRAGFFISTILRSSDRLHDKLVEAILKGPADYFDKNSKEVILKCFSKDVAAMDELLPGVFLDAMQGTLFNISAILLPSIFNPFIFLFVVPLVVSFIAYWSYYLKASRQVRLLEANNRLPVVKHFSETLNGLVVIRNYEMQEEFTEEIFRHQDTYSQACFAAVTCEAWIGLRIDLLCVVFLSIVVFGAHLMNLEPALTGISLVYTIQMACEMSVYGIKRCSDVDSYMTCVQRVMDLSKIDPEPGYSIPTLPHEPWPSAGRINFSRVSLTYEGGTGKKALKDLTISINSREKIGIVGRDNKGKSAVIHALFRMPEVDGQITIDDVDVKGMNVQRMRQGISIITRDPVIFCGNVRANVDPFGKHSDRQIWEVLEKTHIRAWVEALPKQLYQDMGECCSTLGPSEKQLFAIARALLHNTKILVMDEATAGVDYKTDRLIQELIRSKFKNSTILTIPYRLSTIIDYDRVMVLDNGHVTEFDKPEKLLKRSDGFFAHLYSSQCLI